MRYNEVVESLDDTDDDLFGGANHPHGKEIAQDLELWLRRRQSGSRRPLGLMQAEYVENIIAGFNQSFLAGVKAWQQGAAFVSDTKYNIREYLENSMGVDLANQALDESESDDELFGADRLHPMVISSLRKLIATPRLQEKYDIEPHDIESVKALISALSAGSLDAAKAVWSHMEWNELDNALEYYVRKSGLPDIWLHDILGDELHEDHAESDDELFSDRHQDVHDLSNRDDSTVYDITQSSDDIKSGDILKLSNNRWAIMIDFYPVMVVGDSKNLHNLSAGHTFSTIEDGRFAHMAAKAMLLSKKHSIEESDDDMFSSGPRISPRMSLVLRTLAQEMEDTTHRAWQIYKMFEKQGYDTGAAAIRDLPVDEKSFVLKNCFKPAVANHLLKSMSNKSSPSASAIADQMAQGIERCTKNVELINKIADAFNGNDIKHAIQGIMYRDDIHNWLADRDPRLATELDAMIERYQEEDEDF